MGVRRIALRVSDLKKKTLSVLLVILLFNVVASLDVSLNMRTSPAQAQLVPNMYIDPPETKDTLLTMGQEFTVNINITNAENLFAWQANITFNRDVINCTAKTKIAQGTFMSDWFGTSWVSFSRFIYYDTGSLMVGCYKKPPYESGEIGATGNGTLASITFEVVANERATLLQFGANTDLRTVTGDPPVLVNILPITTEDGVFDNRSPGTNTAPVAGFSVLPIAPASRGQVRFDASSSYDTDAWIASHHWDFGDGTTATYMRERLRNINLTNTPTHVYTQEGTYTATLTVEDSDGATASTSSEVTVLFDVAVTNVESPFIKVMPGTIVTIDVTVANYGDFIEECNVTAYYNSTAIETIEVTSLDPLEQQTLTFNWNTTGVDYGKYLLKANASIVDGESNVNNNEYPDGFITIAGSNTINYPVVVGGVAFKVVVESTSSLSAFNFNGTAKTIGFNVTGEMDTEGFSNVTIPMLLLNASSPDAWIVKFNETNISYTPTSNGTHYFIHFSYIHGNTPTTVEIIGETVATPPIALFTASKTTVMAGEAVTFDASTSYDPDGTIESWNWSFGHGTTDTGEIVQHSFASNGTYTVTLTVKDDEQLSNSTQRTITVIDYPLARFSYTPEEPLVDQTINFDATTSDPVGGAIIDYAWEFGDGETGTGQTTTHSYSTTGTYKVKLTVTDSEDLTNATTKTITVKIHDITMTSLTATPSTVRISQAVEIEVTVANQGNFTETFTITVYRNDTTIETQTVTDLIAGSSQILTTPWSTSSVGPGAYTIKAETSIISGETRTDDNSRTGVTVTVQKRISSLTIASSSTALTLGDDAIITGTLTPTLQDKTITLQYRLVGQTWSTLNTMTTDTHGKYEFMWTPDTAGTYEIQAIWQGDASTEACQSDAQTITVKEAEVPSIPIQYVIGALAAIIIMIAIVAYLLRVRKR